MSLFKSFQECQSYRLTVEDPVSLEYITRHVAGMKQRYTQYAGRRPYGISCLLTGTYFCEILPLFLTV